MRFLELRVQAFGPFADPFVLPLDRLGPVLIEGVNLDGQGAASSNWAGKSSILEALSWCLKDKLVRYGDRRLGTEVCNQVTGTADVTVTFETPAGTAMRVRRRKALRGSPRLEIQTQTSDGSAWETIPGTGVHAASATDDLEKILGFDYAVFRYALFLQGNAMGLAAAGFTDQMAALESALRFQILTDAAALASDDRKQRWMAEQDARGRVVTAAQSASAATALIATLEALDETAEAQRLQAEIDALHAQGSALGTDPQRAERQAQQEETRTGTILAGAQAAEARARGDLDRLTRLADAGQCPTCEQPVPASLADAVPAAQKTLARARALLSEAQGAATVARQSLQEARERTNEARQVSDQLQERRRALTALQARQGTRIVAITEAAVQRDAAASAETVALDDVRVAVGQRTLAEFWQRAFGVDGLKAHLMTQAVPILNAAADRYAMILAGDQIQVTFVPNRQNKAEPVLRVSGPGTIGDYLGCSSGGRRRIDLILALSIRALARTMLPAPVNLAAWDEVLDPLDEDGLRRAVEILQQDFDELGTVFVVTHNPQLKALFPGARVIRVTRQGGRSRVSGPEV